MERIRLFTFGRAVSALTLWFSFAAGSALAQQTAASPDATPSAGTATPLSALIEEARRNSPEIAAAQHVFRAATHVPKQLRALPGPELMVQQFAVGSPRPFAGFSNSDFAYIGLGGSQEIPFPGKRDLRAQVAEREADARKAESSSVQLSILERLKATYFELGYVQQILPVLERNDRLLAEVAQIVESRYRVGQGNQQEVLRAQLQRTKILQEITMRRQREGGLQAELKRLLARAQDSPDIITEPLAPRTLPYTAAELIRLAREQNPAIRAREAMQRQAEAQVQVAHREFRPDFKVQYMWQHTADNVRDYYMATFSLMLPNRGRRSAELAQAQETRGRADSELEAELQRQFAEIQNQYVLAQTSGEQLKIYKEGLIPQSDATFRAALAAYQANRQDFETLISSFLDVLRLDIEYQQQLAEHESALARLESLTGVTLP